MVAPPAAPLDLVGVVKGEARSRAGAAGSDERALIVNCSSAGTVSPIIQLLMVIKH